jgi:hypothetical protein
MMVEVEISKWWREAGNRAGFLWAVRHNWNAQFHSKEERIYGEKEKKKGTKTDMIRNKEHDWEMKLAWCLKKYDTPIGKEKKRT